MAAMHDRVKKNRRVLTLQVNDQCMAAMHERVKKNKRVLTLQVNDRCIIHILLKDIHLKTQLVKHVFMKKPSSMRVFNSTIIQLHETYQECYRLKLDEGRKKKRRRNH